MDPYSQTLPTSQKTRRSSRRRVSALASAVIEAAPRRLSGSSLVAWVSVTAFTVLTVGALILTRRAGAQDGASISPSSVPHVSIGSLFAHTDWRVVGTSFGIIGILTILNAVFSMAETALTSVRRSRVEQLVEEKRAGAVAVKRLHEDPPRYIATVQAGITILGFAAMASAATAIAPASTPYIELLGLSHRIAYNIAVVAVVILVALVTLVFGEIAPKAVAMQSPDIWALRLAPLVNVCAVLFAPLNAIVLGISNVLVRPFGAKARFETPMITREEFEQIIESGTEKGEFDRTEQTIIENVIDFSETLVRGVMTPRIDMTAISVSATMAEILQLILQSGHSRLPVYEDTVDNIVGIVHAKDLLPLFAHGGKIENLDLHTVMRQPFFVPESRRVADLLAEMRRSKNQIALVQDEYGGTAGIVSLEDLLEEIVGDIRDEYDVDEPEMQVLSATVSLIDGRMSIADVNDRLGLELSGEEYTTIGGLIFGLIGHEPTIGESARVNGMDFAVERWDGRRIVTVRATRRSEEEAANEERTLVGAGAD